MDDRIEILNCCLDDVYELCIVWERWKGRLVYDIMDWNLGMYLLGSEYLRIYCIYFLIIISCCDNCKFVCFNFNCFFNYVLFVFSVLCEWMNKFVLDFLFFGVDNIIVGRGGFLVVNGSICFWYLDLENKFIFFDFIVKFLFFLLVVGEFVKLCLEYFFE